MNLVEGSNAALAVINSWGWDHADPRFDFYVPVMISLSEAINRLAMEGRDDAPDLVLSMLAGGQLIATGSYRWKRFCGDHFSREGVGQIPARRWQMLKNGCAKNERSFGKEEVTLHAVTGDWAETKEAAADWGWTWDRFSTAEAGGGEWLDVGYFEETYSVADIELRPAHEDADGEVKALTASHAEPNKGGAPTKYDWERAVAAVTFQWADEGSWQPTRQVEVKERLAARFAERDQFPSESLLKERARWLFDEFRRRAPEADNLAA